MTSRHKTQLLKDAIAQWVRLVNVADVEMQADKLCIHVHGKLSYEEDDKTYSVCSVDTHGHGINSVSFRIDRVEDIFQQSSGITEITLY